MITFALGISQWLSVREILRTQLEEERILGKVVTSEIHGAGCFYFLSIPADFVLILLAILFYFGRL